MRIEIIPERKLIVAFFRYEEFTQAARFIDRMYREAHRRNLRDIMAYCADALDNLKPPPIDSALYIIFGPHNRHRKFGYHLLRPYLEIERRMRTERTYPEIYMTPGPRITQ